MSILKIKCKCGRELIIDIKTIDKLTRDNKRLIKERDNYKARLSALEIKMGSNPFTDMFGGIL